MVELDLLEEPLKNLFCLVIGESLDLLVDEAHNAESGMKIATSVSRLDPVAGISTQNCIMEKMAWTGQQRVYHSDWLSYLEL